jgi:hypothetical protein
MPEGGSGPDYGTTYGWGGLAPARPYVEAEAREDRVRDLVDQFQNRVQEARREGRRQVILCGVNDYTKFGARENGLEARKAISSLSLRVSKTEYDVQYDGERPDRHYVRFVVDVP